MEDDISIALPPEIERHYIVLDARESLFTSILRDVCTVACFALLAWFTQAMPFWRVFTVALGGVVVICMLARTLHERRHTFHNAQALRDWASTEAAHSEATKQKR